MEDREKRTDRVLLLTAPSSYRSHAFLNAANALDLEVVQLSDMPDSLNEHYHTESAIDFADIEGATARIASIHESKPLTAIVSVDDAATQLAAVTSAEIGLPANVPHASLAARDKFVMRSVLREKGVKCPDFVVMPIDQDPEMIADSIAYPCVVKPRRMSGSRGVIRANDPAEFISAFSRTARIIRSGEAGGGDSSILIERYIDGAEVAVEGLITGGEVHILAIFDKPDPLTGPFFEETIYVTPSRHSVAEQTLIAEEVTAAAAAVGLRHGPIHAELRLNAEGAWLLEIAGRSIGGL